MARENLVYNSLRLNMNNPQHVKVNEVLCNINTDIYKSKNQFVVDAIEYYIDHFGKERFINIDEKTTRYITEDDLSSLKKEVIEIALTEARREVIKLLGTAVSGMSVPRAVVPVNQNVDKNEELQEDDEVMSDLASSWMEE